MIDHPIFHADPARAQAFTDLITNPVGNYRNWAQRWGWKLARVQRFIIALEKAKLIDCDRTRWGTTIRTRYGADTEVPQPSNTEPIRSRFGSNTEPIPLGSKSGLTTGLGPRPSSRSIDQQQQPPADSYTAACIDTMNEQLGRLFGSRDDYRPVLHDNDASGKTCDRWKAAGVELEFAIEEIRKGCLAFNPSKHGRGKLPGVLKYFQRGVLEAHAARHQTGLPLPPVLQNGGAPREPRRAKSQPVPLAAVLPAALPTAMEEYLETKQAGGARRRL